MRSLFILLVVLNISYLVWGVVFSEKKESELPQQMRQGLQVLTLLSEEPERIVPPKDVGVTSKIKMPKLGTKNKAKDMQSMTCFSLGPFFEEDQIKILESKLLKGGFNPTRKSITDNEPKSYWVYIPAASTMEEAKTTSKHLKAANVKDYFIIRTGKNARAISLGLYNGYNRAKLRKSNLTKLGFEAKVKTRYKKVTRHWLDFQETLSNPLMDEIWMQGDKDIVLQKIARPCADPLPETS